MSAIAIAVGLVTSGVAAGKKAKANKEINKKGAILEDQRAEENAWYNKEVNKDITRSADVQNIMRENSENQRIADARTDAMGLTLGSTAERIDAGHDANRKRYTDSLADVAAAWGERKYNLDKYHLDKEGDYFKGRMGMQDEYAKQEQEASNQYAQTAINAFKTGVNQAGNAMGDFFGTPSSADPNKPQKV